MISISVQEEGEQPGGRTQDEERERVDRAQLQQMVEVGGETVDPIHGVRIEVVIHSPEVSGDKRDRQGEGSDSNRGRKQKSRQVAADPKYEGLSTPVQLIQTVNEKRGPAL